MVLEYLSQNTNECNNCRGNPPTYKPTYGIAYTDATQKYIKVDMSCINKVKTHQGLRVILLDVSLMQENHKAKLNLSPLLSTRGKTAHISPHLWSWELISIGQLCDGGCTTTFTATNMKVKKRSIPRGNHQRIGWNVASTPRHHTTTKIHPNTSIRKKLMSEREKHEILQWYHATLFSPAKQTLIQ